MCVCGGGGGGGPGWSGLLTSAATYIRKQPILNHSYMCLDRSNAKSNIDTGFKASNKHFPAIIHSDLVHSGR